MADKLIINILVVTEEEGGFDPTHRFGLSELVNTLKNAVYDFAQFNVTTAHRSFKANNPYALNADKENFRFDAAFAAAGYHQVWLFGFSNFYNIGGDPFSQATPHGEVFPVSDAELAVIAKFMDAGGGVFATGDHENLGINLCGKIPRVRSMRRWEFDYQKVQNSYDDYDESGTDAPPVFGEFAHDTLVSGHNNTFEFDDQSDDVPQQIAPKIYVSGSRYIFSSFPHPLLCSPKGVINILPDHMHEGQCQVPDDLTKTISFPGYNGAEYPVVGGYRETPEVIAWGTVQGGHAVPLPVGFDPNSIPKYKNATHPTEDDSFGDIAVYDGHTVNVGRVVVDSTFHHFVNINLTGVKEVSASYNYSDDSKKTGFSYSPSGQLYLEKIKTYYCNIALYLTSEDILQPALYKILWKVKFDSQLKMLTPVAHQLNIRNYNHWMFYGKSVYEVLLRQLTPCMALHILIYAIDPLALLCPFYFLKIHLPDPPPDYLSQVDRGEFLFVTLAAIIITMKEKSIGMRENDFRKFNDQLKMRDLLTESRNHALHLLRGLQTERNERTMKYLDVVSKQYSNRK